MRGDIRRRRRILNLSVVALTAGALFSLPTGSEAVVPAPDPHEVSMVAAPAPNVFTKDAVWFVGVSGYLHQRYGQSAFLWTRYADGSTTTATGLPTNPYLFRPAGGDTVAVFRGLNVNLVDLSTGEVRTYTELFGTIAYGWAVDSVLIRLPGATTLSVVTIAADGTNITRPVTGLDGATSFAAPTFQPANNDADDALIRYLPAGDTVAAEAYVNLHTGVATNVPGHPNRVITTPDRVVAFSAATGGVATVYAKAALDTGDSTPIATVTVPANHTAAALVGAHLLIGGPATGNNGVASPLTDVPLDGSAPADRLAYTDQLGFTLLATSDGRAFAIGAAQAGPWDAHFYSANGTELADQDLGPLAAPPTSAGLLLRDGVLRQVEHLTDESGAELYMSFDHPVTDVQPSDPTGSTRLLSPIPCTSGVTCVKLVGGTVYGPVYLSSTGTGMTGIKYERYGAPNLSVSVPSASGEIVDASSQFVVVNGTSPAQQYVVDLTAPAAVRSTGPIGAAALWISTLYRPSTTPGTVVATELVDVTPAKNVLTGAPCVPRELQASSTWLYWSCGASGPAGAHNLTTGANVALPAGPTLLGDGYVVMHEAGSTALELYDFHTGAVADPVTIAQVPAAVVPDDRDNTWSVDPNSGDIAWLDANGAAHIVDPGVPASPVRLVEVHNVIVSNPNGSAMPVREVWWTFSGPVDWWTAKLIDPRTGSTLTTFTGGPTRFGSGFNWDGTIDGHPINSGPYRVEVSVTRYGVTLLAGTIAVDEVCGIPPYRTMSCYGQPSILGVQATGTAYWYEEKPTGGLTKIESSRWLWGSASTQVNAVVPWGDYNGDSYPDVIARSGTGVLEVFQGLGVAGPGGTDMASVKLGTGWNQYTVLTSVGDQTGDGRWDLLARGSDGTLWRYDAKAGGGFNSRVKISTGWNTYRKVLGAGDLTGDGRGDLLAVDSTGVLWRFSGQAGSTFASRVKIGTGWNSFTALIAAGDFNHDGKNDLIARDSSGYLWLYPGTGTGGVSSAGRVKIGTGFNTFAHMF